jgi:nickel transport protein
MRRKHTWCVAVILVVTAGLLPAVAYAHRLNVFASEIDDEVHVEVYFSRGAKAQGAKVEVFDAGGALLAEGRTNEDGLFTCPLPETDGELRIVATTGDAHQGEFTLAVGRDAASGVSAEEPGRAAEVTRASDDGLRGVQEKLWAVERKLVDVQRDLHEYESRVSLDRVLAGVGFIVGLTGVAAFFLARRRAAA